MRWALTYGAIPPATPQKQGSAPTLREASPGAPSPPGTPDGDEPGTPGSAHRSGSPSRWGWVVPRPQEAVAGAGQGPPRFTAELLARVTVTTTVTGTPPGPRSFSLWTVGQGPPQLCQGRSGPASPPPHHPGSKAVDSSWIPPNLPPQVKLPPSVPALEQLSPCRATNPRGELCSSPCPLPALQDHLGTPSDQWGD